MRAIKPLEADFYVLRSKKVKIVFGAIIDLAASQWILEGLSSVNGPSKVVRERFFLVLSLVLL